MATVAELRVPAEEFALAETFERCPDAEFEVLQAAASTTTGPGSLVWASGSDPGRIEAALAADPSVESAAVVDDRGDRLLHRLSWASQASVVVAILLHDAVATEVVAADGCWRVEAIFPDREALSTAYDLSERYGVDFEVANIYALSDDCTRTFDLTEKQRDTLAVAHELGYFKIPREVSLDELADRIGISRQAISERLRRAHDALVASTVRSGDDRRVRR